MFLEIKTLKQNQYFIKYDWLGKGYGKGIFQLRFEETKNQFRCQIIYPTRISSVCFNGNDIVQRVFLCKICDDVANKLRLIEKCECFKELLK